jgi:tripartite-type tricarboxylate transporter receptor subunit TctC
MNGTKVLSRFSLWSLWFMLFAVFPFHAGAQPYPSKAIRFVVPYPAGGPLDTVARLLGQKVAESTKQPVVVDNKPGAGGNIGADIVAKSAPDGYTILMGAVATHAINPALYAKIPYDPIRDFAPVTQVASTPNILVVNPAIPASNVQEFIAYAKANPGKLSYGTSATGTSPQLTMELLKSALKFDVVHIAYKGAPQALSDVIGGQIPASMQTAPAVLPTIQSGRVRALAVTSLKRLSQLPSVPTFDETVMSGLEVTTWYGLCAPAGVPTAILDKVQADLTAILRTPEIQERFREMVIDAAPISREEFAQFIRTETARWARVIKAAGIPQQ